MRGILLVVTLATCGVTACAMPSGPTSEFVRAGWERLDAAGEAGTLATFGVVVDVVLAIDNLDEDDYFAVEESRAAATLILEATVTCLEAKGYDIAVRVTPFVGAYKAPDQTFLVAASKGAEVSRLAPPFFTDGLIAADESLQAALQVTIRKILRFANESDSDRSRQLETDETLKQSFSLIADRTGLEYLLVVIGHGLADYLDTYIALVDLKRDDIPWSNSIRIKPGNPNAPDFYERWSWTLLYHLPSRGAHLASGESDEQVSCLRARP
jgi:hypothetical protein